MGTYCTITLENPATPEIQEGFDYLRKIESVLSSYQPDSQVSRLNRGETVAYDPMLAEVLQRGRDFYTITEGYFDITVGSITKKLYHFGEEEQIPTEAQKQQAHLGIDRIEIGKEEISVGEGIVIDLGGVGKGYAIDLLSTAYREKNITQGSIALSGDIRCLDACTVEIQDPFTEEGTVAVLQSKIPNLSVSTSGTYRRYVQQQKEHHLINPKKKTQGRAFVSVTVVTAADNAYADAMATAISVMPYEEAVAFVRSQEKFGYLLISAEGQQRLGNLEKFVNSSF